MRAHAVCDGTKGQESSRVTITLVSSRRMAILFFLSFSFESARAVESRLLFVFSFSQPSLSTFFSLYRTHLI